MRDLIGKIGRDSWGDGAFRPRLLAEALHKGQLALVLGAGVSKSLKLPLWHELTSVCARRVGLHALADRINKDTATEELRKAFDSIFETYRGSHSELLQELVSEGLYGRVRRAQGVYSDEAAFDPLLIALGGLTMNSKRGSVSEIVTLNFDDLLEWFLDFHGFSTQVVTSYPRLLRSDADVRVYHPHGFVPLRQAMYGDSDSFVLSNEQYLETLAKPEAPWSIFLKNLFLSKILLFIGTRVEDPDIQLLLKQAESTLSGRPFGYLLIERSELTEAREKEIRRRNLEPLTVDSYKTSHLELLRICQDAACRSRQPPR